MRVEVFLTPGEVSPPEIADRTVVIIDVLRASSTIVEAIAAGAQKIFPVTSIEEALRLAHTLGREEVLLCGERKCLPIDGFDLGNSPREFTADRVAGKTLVMSTTNGTTVIGLTTGASRVLIASMLNLSAVVRELARGEDEPVIVCSGREGRFGLEDAVCAGEIVRRLTEARPSEWKLDDGAVAAVSLARVFSSGEELFRSTAAGAGIAAAGFEEDLAFCARTDRHDIVPMLQDRQIIAAPIATG